MTTIETEESTDPFEKWYKAEGHHYPVMMEKERVVAAMRIAYNQGAADALGRSIDRRLESMRNR